MVDAPEPVGASRQDALYAQAALEFGGALTRLARAYEMDPDRRQDLLQDIHIALWRSFSTFDGRCSLRTWVYRVAHNVAASQVIRRRARVRALVSLDELASMPDTQHSESSYDRRLALDRLLTLIHALQPADKQVMLLYLEGVDAASIGEITGISPANVATKVHRIKQTLARRFHEGRAS